jgi:hypothetical protein
MKKLYKLFLLFTTCSFCFSCGKKFKEEINSSDAPDRRFAEALSVKLESSFSPNKKIQISSDSYIFENNAELIIPPEIKVLEGNAADQYAKIEFNVENDTAEYYCLYRGGATSSTPETESDIALGKKYLFEDCYQDVNNDGVDDPLGYYPGYPTLQFQDYGVRLVILGADDRTFTRVETKLEVIWR